MTLFIRAYPNRILYLALLSMLGALLWLSPAEVTLGNVVKLVYAHGAAQRIAVYAYLVAGALGFAALVLRLFWSRRVNDLSAVPATGVFVMTDRWTRALIEAALLFYLAQFLISLPAQVLAWGGISWSEPRVASALWILVFTGLVYGVALWMDDTRWMAFAAVANVAIVLILLRGAANLLHPIDPILGSESLVIKLFYLAIVATTGALAFVFARDRAQA